MTLTKTPKIALKDIVAALVQSNIATVMGLQDVRQRYRRSLIGPFWITISMGIMIGTVSIVFGRLFKSPVQEFLPFISIGFILWGFISTVILEGCAGFIAAEKIVKQLPVPMFTHILRLLWRNVLILFHNLLIVPLVFFAVSRPLTWMALLSVPGFVILIMNLGWVILILALLCARYRDLAQIVESTLQIVFYLTPIIWMPSLLSERMAVFLLDMNPIFHLIEIVRLPLLGQSPKLATWVISCTMMLFGWLVALVIYGQYKCRIAYWL